MKNYLKWPIFLVVWFVFSYCGQQKEEEPLTIPEEKWVQVLVDAHMIEASLQDVAVKQRDSISALFYGQMFDIHSISESEFQQNLRLMDSQPQRLSRIYAKVLEEISKIEAKAN